MTIFVLYSQSIQTEYSEATVYLLACHNHTPMSTIYVEWKVKRYKDLLTIALIKENFALLQRVLQRHLLCSNYWPKPMKGQLNPWVSTGRSMTSFTFSMLSLIKFMDKSPAVLHLISLVDKPSQDSVQ